MSPPVFSASRQALIDAPQVVVDGSEGHHGVTVLRLRLTERVRLTDGAGTVVDGAVVEVGPAWFTVKVEHRQVYPAPQPRIVVVQALAKGEHSELAVSLLTQVGVDEIVPWAAERCVVRWAPERRERALTKWQNTAREAAKQSRRTWWPTVVDLASTRDVAIRVRQATTAIVLDESAKASLASVDVPTVGDILLVVGPEGGITDRERSDLVEAGATVAVAGPTVLRTSSAGSVAASVLLSRTARWST